MLCVGPLSKNITDVASEISQKHNLPIVLIASRRQIDCADFGGGYANGWTTENFSEYVNSLNVPGVFLARDHGGPNQGNHETDGKLDPSSSMMAAKKSFEADIDAGFRIIHIDPSVPAQNEDLKYETIMNRLLELYGHVTDYALSKGKHIELELGTEEQRGSSPDCEYFNHFLSTVKAFANKNKLPNPLFVVVQTGTKVMEMRNIGVFENSLASVRNDLIRLVKRSAEVARDHGCFIKEHNTDYLSLQNLILRPKIGIKAANVAPELGVTETQALLFLLKTYSAHRDVNRFMNLVLDSKKWEKWTTADSHASLTDRVLLAGHYCFNLPEVSEIKDSLRQRLKSHGLDLDQFLKSSIRTVFYKYLSAFGLL